MTTRRTFIGSASRSLVGMVLARQVIPITRTSRHTTPAAWLPDPIDGDRLRALAAQAIDAARQAGASFADIRAGERRTFRLGAGYVAAVVSARAGYGVRVLVDGTWGMARGEALTSDAVATVARDAVAAARRYAAVNVRVAGRPVVLAPTPAVTGEWTSPAAVSPFAVPIDDHARVLGSWLRAVAPIQDMELSAGVRWAAETRVVASSEGTLVTQHLTRVVPDAWLRFGMRRHTEVGVPVPTLVPATAGFELIMAPELPDQIAAAAEDALRLARLPERPFQFEGRCPVVFDGAAVATMLGMTLGPALDGDRVVGLEADAAGRSFLAPDRAVRFSPLVTVTVDRAPPSYTAVQWDDEGVAPSPVTVVDHGHVRSCLTTRETAAALAPDVRSTGSAVAPDPTQLVLSGGAHFALAPSDARATLDGLLRDITHGVLCCGGTCLPEPNLSTGLFRGRMLIEVRQGRPVARVHDVMFQFQTRRWWSDRLRGLGDAGTVATTLVTTQKGMPWQDVIQEATAPAALLADVDVVRTDVIPL